MKTEARGVCGKYSATRTHEGTATKEWVFGLQERLICSSGEGALPYQLAAVELFKRSAAVLELRARVATGGLHIGMDEDVSDQHEIATVLAHQPRRDRMTQPVRRLLHAGGRHQARDELAD